MSKLEGKDDHEKLTNLEKRTYKEQAIHLLNCYWDKLKGDAENIWSIVNKCAQLDLQKHGAGCALDEVNAHRLLEVLGETLTVLALRERLRKTGAIEASERPKEVPLTHYLLFKYDVDWRVLVSSSGDNLAELEKAQALLDQVLAAFKEAEKAANHARLQEAPFKAAQEEVDAALAEVTAQDDARKVRTMELEKLSTDPAAGVFQQSKAKNELAQHLAEDSLPLRKAKITLEAALKKAEKAR